MKSQELRVYIEDLPNNTKTPILSYCRKLIEDGYSEDTKVNFYRKNRENPDILVKHLGRASKITVRETQQVGPVFVKFKEMGQDSLERSFGRFYGT